GHSAHVPTDPRSVPRRRPSELPAHRRDENYAPRPRPSPVGPDGSGKKRDYPVSPPYGDLSGSRTRHGPGTSSDNTPQHSSRGGHFVRYKNIRLQPHVRRGRHTRQHD